MDEVARRRKKLTSIELAALAGVSSATVSRAFSPGARIKPETRRQILALAEEHGFRPNALARSLNNSQSRLVAIIVNTAANPAEGEGVNELVRRLQALELTPLLLCCADHEDRGQLMRIASTYQVDHVVLQSDMVSIADATDIFRDAHLIVASAEPLEARALCDVRGDAADAAEAVVQHLPANGRRRFAYLSGRGSSFIDKQRMTWFADALARRGLRFEAVAHGDYSYDAGYKEAALLLPRFQPDVLISANDVMAIGVQRCFFACWIACACREDLALVGHDGVALAGWESHSVTSIAPSATAITDALIGMIVRGPDAPPSQVIVPAEVRWRRSTGAPG